jgi:hypothetical protein
MASDPAPPSETPPPPPPPAATGPSPISVWLQRSGLPGKLLAFGGLGGILILLIYLISYRGGLTWHGFLALIAYIGCVVAAWFLYQSQAESQRKTWLYVALASAGVAGLFGLWLLILGLQWVLTFGILVNFVAAVAVVLGAVLEAKAQKLF